jgi:GDPmannose 4,6-dehydratase
MLVTAFDSVGLGDPLPYVELDPHLWSSTQASALRGDASKANKQLGWTAETSFEALIADMVAVDMRRIRSGVDESADYLR